MEPGLGENLAVSACWPGPYSGGWPGVAQKGYMDPPSCEPVICRRGCGGQEQWQTDHQWPKVGGKEILYRYTVGIGIAIGITAMHSSVSGTPGEELPMVRGTRQVWVCLLIAPWFSASFTLVNERVAYIQLHPRGWALSVVCPYALNTSSKYPTSLETLDGVLDGAPSGDSIVPTYFSCGCWRTW